MAVDITASIDEVAVASFNETISQYAKSLGYTPQEAVRYASILLCKSLRAATLKAPKFARSSEYEAVKSNDRPKYITKDGASKLRRFDVNWHIKGVKFSAYAQSRTDLRKNRLKLRNAGLAKQSWGWVMRRLFNGEGEDVVYQRRKNDRRDPTVAVSGSSSRSYKSGNNLVSEATISNKIDYILSALKGGATVSSCVKSAENKMLHLMRMRMESMRS